MVADDFDEELISITTAYFCTFRKDSLLLDRAFWWRLKTQPHKQSPPTGTNFGSLAVTLVADLCEVRNVGHNIATI
jgi:hypothetical protein